VVQQQQLDPQEEASFENVERLLRDCRDLLDGEQEADLLPLPLQPETQSAEGLPRAA
jgi:hypothetical protein